MKAHTHLKPGQNGTKRLVERFGNALVAFGTGMTRFTISVVIPEEI